MCIWEERVIQKQTDAEFVVYSVKACSACGQDHELRVTKLAQPTIDGWEYSGVCPNTGIEVLLRQRAEPS